MATGNGDHMALNWYRMVVIATALGLPAASWADEAPLQGGDVHLTPRSGGPPRFYPQAAQAAHLEGHASALCLIAGNGDLTDCKVFEETPEGHGFGDGVVRLAEHMHAGPKAKDGSPTAGRQFLFKLTFKLPPG